MTIPFVLTINTSSRVGQMWGKGEMSFGSDAEVLEPTERNSRNLYSWEGLKWKSAESGVSVEIQEYE
jgi:hypothetical protein